MSSEKDSAEDQPLVTLAVKAYRQEATVREAIESAFAQTYPNLEIILSDDCSPDGTFRVMQEMAAAYEGPHRVRLNRNSRNLGVVGHENRLWELATGQLFAHCAGDDVAEPDRIARLVAAWEAGGGRVLLVHSAALEIDAEGRDLGVKRPDPRILNDPRPLDVARTMTNHIGATALQDRRLHEVFGAIFEECGVEDGPQFFRATLLGKVAYVDEPLVRYRIGGLSAKLEMETGYEHLYGQRMVFTAWVLGNLRAFLRDLEKVPEFPDRDECRALCRRGIARRELEVAMWRASPLRKPVVFARALRRSWLSGNPGHARQAFKHLLGPVYVFWHDRRRRRAGRV